MVSVLNGADASPSPQAFVPTYIFPGETFTVPEFRQALYALPIVNDGVLITDGNIVAVD